MAIHDRSTTKVVDHKTKFEPGQTILGSLIESRQLKNNRSSSHFESQLQSGDDEKYSPFRVLERTSSPPETDRRKTAHGKSPGKHSTAMLDSGVRGDENSPKPMRVQGSRMDLKKASEKRVKRHQSQMSKPSLEISLNDGQPSDRYRGWETGSGNLSNASRHLEKLKQFHQARNKEPADVGKYRSISELISPEKAVEHRASRGFLNIFTSQSSIK